MKGMIKNSIILAGLFLMLLGGWVVFSGTRVHASPDACEEKAGKDCVDNANSTTCNACSGAGCSWDEAGPCSGTNQAPCSEYDITECEPSHGECCYWDARGRACAKLSCSGMDATACSACSCTGGWDPANCYGTLDCSVYGTSGACVGCSQCEWITTTTTVPVDTCTPPDEAAWEVNCTDYCNKTDGVANVTKFVLYGTGTFIAENFNITCDNITWDKNCKLIWRNSRWVIG